MTEPNYRIMVRGEYSQRWVEGAYQVWLIHGGCQIRQGAVEARANNAVLWVDPGDVLQGEPARVIAYLENDVVVDVPRGGERHNVTGRSATTVTAAKWIGRFHTTAGVDIDTEVVEPAPAERPGFVDRSIQAMGWADGSSVQPAQFIDPQAAAVMARRVSIRSRSNVRLQAKSFPSPIPGETIVAINSGVQIIVEGIQNVPGIETGTVTIEADRIVFWTTALSGLNLSGNQIQQTEGRWEFYLEGNIVFREGDRVIYADRMYYDVNGNRGTVLNAEMLTPVPDYEGLIRLKADILQQIDRQNFVAYGGAMTSSRMGVPRYWFQSQTIQFRDIQHPQTDPFSGGIAVDPITGEAAVEHELRARSRNNFLYVSGLPVLYWPVIATDLTKPTFYVDRVRLGNDSVFGTKAYIDWDMYQVLGIENRFPGSKWTASTDWLSDRGFGYGTNFSYSGHDLLGIPGYARGFLDAWAISDSGVDNLGADRRALIPEEDFRGRVLGRHRQNLPRGFQLTSELGWISDRNFLEQYYEDEWDTFKDATTGFELKQLNGNRSWNITSTRRLNDFFTQTEWIPRVDHFLLGQSLLFDSLNWSAHSQVGYARLFPAEAPSGINPVDTAKFDPLAWEREVEGLRAATRQRLELPFDMGYFKVVPYAMGEVAHWGQDLQGEDLTRAYGQAGVRAALPFWRANPSVQSTLFNLNGLAHKVVLDAEFFWADANQDLNRLPLYDPLDDDATEHFRRRFYFDTFSGVPGGNISPEFDERIFALRSGMQRWVTATSTEIADDLMTTRLGLRQRWQTKRGLPGQERITDWIVLDLEGSFFPEDDRDNFGKLLGLWNYDFRWHVGDRLTLLSDGFTDFFPNGLRTLSIGGMISRPERGNLYVGYRSIEGPISSSLLNASLAYWMTEKWIVSAAASVDFGETGNIGQNIALTRVGESMLVRIGFRVDESRGDFGVNVAVEPRFLPRTRLGSLSGIRVPPAGALGLE